MPSKGGDGGQSKAAVVVGVGALALAAGAVAYAVKRRQELEKNGSPGKPQNLVWNKPLSELPTDKAVPVVDGAYLLAEGIVWCSRKQELWWVDINGKKVMRLRRGGVGESGGLVAEGWDTPTRPGSVALRDGTGREPDCPLIVAFEDAFSLYNPFTGKRVPAAGSGLADEYKQLPNTRLNDGRCDRQGRYVCGGLNLENIDEPADVWKPIAGVYRVEDGKGVRRILPDEAFRCYNGTCFSPDGGTMYNAETPLMKINCYDHDVATGAVSNKRLFVDLEDGLPDGATVDSEGCLWVAVYGSGEVRRYSPDGELLRTIPVPGAMSTTCVTLGGPDLNILFISSASVGLDDVQRLEQPYAGALFAIRLEGVKGLAEPCYRG